MYVMIYELNFFSKILLTFSAGVGRTGVFIGLCNLIERVRVEGFADVFQTVREMRCQRPAMVQTKVIFFQHFTLYIMQKHLKKD